MRLWICSALTGWQRDAVALGVEQAADLLQVTVTLHHVLQLRRLHQVGVALALHPLNALGAALHEHRRTRRLHERPHPLVGGDLGVPEGETVESHGSEMQEGGLKCTACCCVIKFRDFFIDVAKTCIKSRCFINFREWQPQYIVWSLFILPTSGARFSVTPTLTGAGGVGHRVYVVDAEPPSGVQPSGFGPSRRSAVVGTHTATVRSPGWQPLWPSFSLPLRPMAVQWSSRTHGVLS